MAKSIFCPNENFFFARTGDYIMKTCIRILVASAPKILMHVLIDIIDSKCKKLNFILEKRNFVIFKTKLYFNDL